MKRLLTAVVLIPLVLVLALRAPLGVLAAFVAFVAVLTIQELLDLAQRYGITPLRKPVYIFTVVLILALAFAGQPQQLFSTALMMYGAGFAAVLAPFLFTAIAMRRQDLRTAFPGSAVSSFAVVYIGLPLAFIVQIREMWAGSFLILYLLVVVWVGDIAAYYVGRTLGRHKLAPRISPGKTWEGSVGSFIAAIVAGYWLFSYGSTISLALLNVNLMTRVGAYLSPEPPQLWQVVLLSGLINVAAQFGDLVESLIKRGAGVKDSGAILPGHGGMLDRIDALLFAVPVLWYYAALQVISQGHI